MESELRECRERTVAFLAGLRREMKQEPSPCHCEGDDIDYFCDMMMKYVKERFS